MPQSTRKGEAAPEAGAQQPEFSAKMVLVPALMLGLRFMKLDLSEYVVILRICYVVSTLFSTGVYVYIMQHTSKSEETVEVVEKMIEEKRRTVKIGDYDSEEAFKKIKAAGVAVCVVGFIHLKWGSPMPLLLQSIMQPLNLTDDPLVQIYFFKKPATGKLKRPFKTSSPLQDLLEGGGNKDDSSAETNTDAAAAKKKAN